MELWMKKIIILAALVAVVLPAVSNATVITPVDAIASSTFGTYDVEDLVNNSGLSGGLHDTNYTNMWMNNAEGTGGQLTFNLGGTYAVTSSDIWQYNATCCGLNRGVKDFDILASTNGIDFTLITSSTLTQSSGGLIAAQNIVFNAVASYIRFDILSNYGDTTYTGLSEVKFNADPIPEPVSIALIVFGLLGFGFYRKRK